MRRKDKKIEDNNIIKEILKQSEICRIAMMDEDKPYIVPLNFGYCENALYVHSAPAGKKIELLRKNNKVCFEVTMKHEIIKPELSCEWTTKYRSVIGYGTVEIIEEFEEKKNGLDIIMAQHGRKEGNIYKDKQVEFIVILKINIDEISGKQSGDWE